MTEKQKEQRKQAKARSFGFCFVCGKNLGSFSQYAHRIANTQQNREKYGSIIIDHTLNGEYVCSLEFNSNMNIGNKPIECLKLIKKIVEYELNRLGVNYAKTEENGNEK